MMCAERHRGSSLLVYVYVLALNSIPVGCGESWAFRMFPEDFLCIRIAGGINRIFSLYFPSDKFSKGLSRFTLR